MTAIRPVISRAHDWLVRATGKPVFWVMAVALLGGWPIARAVLTDVPAPPPVLGTLPSFELVNQHGQQTGWKDLQGKVWVAGFMFTRCPSICPELTARMRDVQRRARNLGDSFHVVSITVDPAHDTPEVLAKYAQDAGVRPHAWTFLTGPPGAVRELVVKGFKLAVGEVEPGAPIESLGHDTHLVLVDGAGRVRGYYDSSNPAEIDRLLREAGLLANSGGS